LLLTVSACALAASAADRGRISAPVYGDGSDLGEFLTVGSHLLFTTNTAGEYRLWSTDGTVPGTVAICAGCRSLRYLGGEEGSTFFVAFVDTRFRLGWTDGSAAGTRLAPATGDLATHSPGVALYSPSLGRLLFVLGDGDRADSLWSWDGNDRLPVRLHRFASAAEIRIGSIAEAQGTTYLQVLEYKAPAGPEISLWTTDGTAGGTRRVGTLPAHFATFGPIAAAGDGVVFYATSSLCEARLWSASAERQPQLIATISDHRCRVRDPIELRSVAGRAFFYAYDDDHDQELWSSDGTAAGTHRLTDFQDPYALGFFSYPLWETPTWDAWTFFEPQDSGARGLWRTDGTPGGTVYVTAPCGGDCPETGLALAHDRTLYWLVRRSADQPFELWSTDGFSEATQLASVRGRSDAALSVLVGAGDTIFAFLWDPSFGIELWGHTLGATGFRRLAALSYPHLFYPTILHGVLDGRVYFPADDHHHGNEPWVSDGTVAGTHLFADLAPRGTGVAPPPAPWNLHANPGVDRIGIDWTYDPERLTTGLHRVEMRGPGHDWTEVAVVDSQSTGADVLGLDADTPYSFRVRTENAAGTSPPSETVSATTGELELSSGPCPVSDTELCLLDGRFAVRVAWWDQHNSGATPRLGVGNRVPGTAGRTGYFWFFKPDNVELIVKLLDGGGVNGYAWAFYGALTDVEYWITIVDRWNARSVTYHNPPGEICGRGDTAAFFSDSAGNGDKVPGASSTGPGVVFALDRAVSWTAAAAHPAEPCAEDATTLCLLGGRYRVQVDWQDQHNHRAGVGGALPYADRTGFFWFFKPDNVELVVKVLDGTPVNGKVWVLYGALTDVGYTLTVTDTATGHDVKRYVNQPGDLCGGADTAAF